MDTFLKVEQWVIEQQCLIENGLQNLLRLIINSPETYLKGTMSEATHKKMMPSIQVLDSAVVVNGLSKEYLIIIIPATSEKVDCPGLNTDLRFDLSLLTRYLLAKLYVKYSVNKGDIFKKSKKFCGKYKVILDPCG